jgi:hypothetical protein
MPATAPGVQLTIARARPHLPRRSALPPIDCWPLAHDVRGQFRIAKAAELPQLLRRPRVLKDRMVHAEGIQLTVTEAVDRGAHPLHQRRQLALVISRHCFPRRRRSDSAGMDRGRPRPDPCSPQARSSRPTTTGELRLSAASPPGGAPGPRRAQRFVRPRQRANRPRPTRAGPAWDPSQRP